MFEKIFTDYRTVSSSNLRTIYLVTSANSDSSVKGGISRVEKYFYSKLRATDQTLIRVLPVVWNGKTFVVIDNNQTSEPNKRLSKKQLTIWNPSKNDILFFQFYTIFGTRDDNKIQAITGRCKIAISILINLGLKKSNIEDIVRI
jgi:hypothetical protein